MKILSNDSNGDITAKALTREDEVKVLEHEIAQLQKQLDIKHRRLWEIDGERQEKLFQEEMAARHEASLEGEIEAEGGS